MDTDLFEDHRAIILAADDIVNAVADGEPFDLPELGRKRTKLANLLVRHLGAEQRQIHAPLMATGGLAALPTAASAAALARDLHQRYSIHVRKWTLHAIEADPAGYAAAIADLQERLKQVLSCEEEQLYRPALALLSASTSATLR